MGRIAELHFGGLDSRPFGSQPPGKIAADGRRNHRHHDEIEAGADLDSARKTAMQLAIWLTLSLFIGAFSAAAAAMEGGGLRDGTWGKKTSGNTALSR